MTTTLKWRLGKLPTSDEVLRLIDNKIITKEEGKDILFNQETEEDISKKDLEEEIKFLREVVQKLSSNKTKIIEVIKEVQKPYYQWGWYGPYATWCNIGSGDSGSVSSLNGSNTTNTYYAATLGGLGTAVGLVQSSSVGDYSTGDTSNLNFSDIKTF